MLFYFFSIICFSAALIMIPYNGYIKHSTKTSRNNVITVFLMTFMGLATGLRGMGVGNDTENYYTLFNWYGKLGTNILPQVEHGFGVVCYLFYRFISPDYIVFQLVVSFFLYFAFTYLIVTISNDPLYSTFLFFLIEFSFFCNPIRQAISTTILCLGYYIFLKDGHTYRFLILAFIACLFHKSAIIACLVYLISKKITLTNKRAIFLVITSLMLCIFKVPSTIVKNMLYINDYVGTQPGLSIMALAILYLILYGFISIKVDNFGLVKYSNNNICSFYNWMAVVSLCCCILSFDITAFTRLTNYFSVFFIFSLPMALKGKKQDTRKKQIMIVFLVFLVYQTLILIFRPEWVTEYMYRFWKFNEVYSVRKYLY